MNPINRLFALWQGSLRLRLLATTLFVLLIGIWVMSLYIGARLQDEMREAIGQHQLELASEIAFDMNDALVLRLQALEAVAASVAPLIGGPPDELQRALEQRPVPRLLFNAGFLVFNSDGTAIADVPPGTGRTGTNYLEYKAMAAALKDGRSSISSPISGKVLKVPVFPMVVPIRNSAGRIVGAMAGVTNLTQPNFLSALNRRHFIPGGRHMLVVPGQRLIAASSDPEFTMTYLPPFGESPLVDRFVAGFEGTGIATNNRGERVLASARRIPVTGWYVATAVPTEIAFAAANTMRRQAMLAAMLLSMIAGGLVWWLLSRQLAPLAKAVVALEGRFPDRDVSLPLLAVRKDEVGRLIEAFNQLLGKLSAREASLRDSEESYRALFELSPEAIIVIRSHRIVFANHAAKRLLEQDTGTALVGREWRELIEPEDWPRNDELLEKLLRGELSELPSLERCFRMRGGRVLDLEITGSRAVFGGEAALVTVIREVSERRRTEQNRLEEVSRQRDTLVREVHHRIKNNLQSVAGLLQRELGSSPKLDSALQVAISQVNSIAVVHGLQSKHAGESIRLCDCLENICRVASELTHRPLAFELDSRSVEFRPAWVNREEAISLALVLNELVLNAIKHSPPDGATPTATLSTNGELARLIIRNQVLAKPMFDFAKGVGFGMGLQLVRSLLPDRGVHLAYIVEDEESVVRTEIVFSSPVLVPDPLVVEGPA